MRWLSDQAVDRLRAAAEALAIPGTRYRILEPLGRGGMGIVMLAEDTVLARRVALKVLDVADESGELAARMLREAQILARLEHPGIVPVYDVGTLDDARVFYTMKYVQGRRLDQDFDPATPLQERLRIFVKICEAVAFAHAHGVLHRDLKPQNIMIGSFGEVLVMDWGVAKILSGLPQGAAAADLGQDGSSEPRSAAAISAGPADAGATDHGAVLGTPGYMAPEQERGEIDRQDKRTDVYALGAILLFLLTVRPPVSGQARLGGHGVSIPRALQAIQRKAMSPAPAERYADAERFAADVARFLDGLPVSVYRENIFGRTGRVLSRYRAAVVLILAYLLMRIAFVFWVRR